eukprot:65865_1
MNTNNADALAEDRAEEARKKEEDLARRIAEMDKKEKDLAAKALAAKKKEKDLAARKKELADKKRDLADKRKDLAAKKKDLAAKKKDLEAREKDLENDDRIPKKKRRRAEGADGTDGPARKRQKRGNKKDTECEDGIGQVLEIDDSEEEPEEDAGVPSGSPSPELEVGLDQLNKASLIAMVKKKEKEKQREMDEFYRREQRLGEREDLMLRVLQEIKGGSKDDADESDEEDLNPDIKGWRIRYGGKKGHWFEVVKEILEKKFRGIATLKEIMIRKNHDFNKKNLFKEGYVDWEVP